MKTKILALVAILGLITNLNAAGLLIGGKDVNGAGQGFAPTVAWAEWGSSVVSAAGEGMMGPDYDSRTWMVRGYIKDHPDYANWASNVVWHIYKYGHPPLENMVPFDYRLQISDISQFQTDKTNKNIWSVAKIAARKPSARFRASRMKFVGRSSDSNNYLQNTTSLDGTNIVFGFPFYGITYNGAARTNDTIRSSATGGYIADVDLDETIFIGEQWPHFLYTTTAQSNAIVAYVMGVTNFAIAGEWILQGEGDTVLTRVGKTVGVKASPMQPVISISADRASSQVFLGGNLDPFVSAVLYHRPTVSAPWHDEGSFHVGQAPYVFEQDAHGFFVLMPQ